MSKRWYVVHAYSGFEKSVMKALKERIARAGMGEFFGQILVPVEEVVDVITSYSIHYTKLYEPGGSLHHRRERLALQRHRPAHGSDREGPCRGRGGSPGCAGRRPRPCRRARAR